MTGAPIPRSSPSVSDSSARPTPTSDAGANGRWIYNGQQFEVSAAKAKKLLAVGTVIKAL